MIRATAAVIRKELRSLVTLPHTYAIAAAFLAISGTFFLTFLIQSNLPDLEQYYSNIASTLLVLAGWSVEAIEPLSDALEDAFRQAVLVHRNAESGEKDTPGTATPPPGGDRRR